MKSIIHKTTEIILEGIVETKKDDGTMFYTRTVRVRRKDRWDGTGEYEAICIDLFADDIESLQIKITETKKI